MDRGEVAEEDCTERSKSRKKEPKKPAQTDGARRPSKKKKRKNLKTRTVKMELVYVRECAAFLETVREERGIPAEEAMVRLAIDGGQGSLKVVANLFKRYFLCDLSLHLPSWEVVHYLLSLVNRDDPDLLCNSGAKSKIRREDFLLLLRPAPSCSYYPP